MIRSRRSLLVGGAALAAYAALPSMPRALAAKAPGWRGSNALYIAQKLGLTSGLELCLDAGDAASLSSSPTKWLDLSGNGYDFDLGDDGTHPGSDEPTQTGTPGALSSGEYLLFDGGDWLTYDSANETWMENIHKDNAAFTLAAVLRRPSGASIFAGTSGRNQGPDVGFNWGTTSTNGIIYQLCKGGAGGSQQNLVVGGTDSVPNDAMFFTAISLDEAVGSGGIIYQVNGTQNTATSTYSSPSASSATQALRIASGASTNRAIMGNTSRIGIFLAWSRALKAGELMAYYNAIRGRVSL